MKDIYSGPATNPLTKKTDYCPDIMRHKIAICKQLTLPHYTQVRVKVVAKISGLMHTKSKNFSWTGPRVCSTNEVHIVVKSKLLEILLSYFSAVGKKVSKGMVISYGTRSLAIRTVVIGFTTAEISESLNLMVNQATAATIRPELCSSI